MELKKKILGFRRIMDLQKKNDGYQMMMYNIMMNYGIEKKMVCGTNYGFAKK